MPRRAARIDTDRQIASLSARQGGVVARRQLLAAGVSRHAIDHRLRSGLLTQHYPGVYLVGCPEPSPRGRQWAAVLAGGPLARFGLRTAAERHGLLSGSGALFHVITPHRHRDLDDVRFRRVQRVSDLVHVDGLPCTSVARTLVDLAGSEVPRVIEQALDQAERLSVLDWAAIERVCGRGRKGSVAIREIARGYRLGTTMSRSDLEEAMLAFCRARLVKVPELNQRYTLASGREIEIDALWREEGVAIELDSRAYHGHDAAFERDRGRDLELEGSELLRGRVTGRMIARDGDWLERQLRRLMREGRARRSVANRAV